MNKDLRRLLELSGQVHKNQIVAGLYENYATETEYDGQGPMKGLEGPFKMKNGRVVYYDTKEGKYYDRRQDMYLSDEEANALNQEGVYEASVVLHATRGDETIALRVEGMSSLRPMVTMLRNNGYDDFEYSDGENDLAPLPSDDYDVDMSSDDPLTDIHGSVDRLSGAMQSGQEFDPVVQDHLTHAAQHLSMAADAVVGTDVEPQAEPDMDMAPEPQLPADPQTAEPQMESETIEERELTDTEKEKLDSYKKKYEGSAMHKAMVKQYGKEKGDEVFYAKLTKAAKGEEELAETAQGRDRSTKVTPSTSRGLDKKQEKAARSKERQQGKKAALDEAEGDDTSKKFSKGDEVKYKGKEYYIIVPDGKANLVGISDNMKGGKIDMVKASELSDHETKAEEKAEEKAEKKAEKKDDKVEEQAVSVTVFDNDAMPADAVDDMEQKDERTGQADRTETKNVVPKEVMQALDKRVSELKKSVERYDGKGYNEKSVKRLSIEALEQIKKNLQRGDHEGFMEAQIFFTTLMSPIWDMIPGQVVNYLAKGDDSGNPDAA